STLLIPAVYYKKTILFKLSDSDFQADLQKKGMVQVFDFHQFLPQEIKFDSFVKQETKVNEFIENYFYKADGKASERLSNILKA
ncbi:MAG TPA: hypothetical protein VD794_01785, partial [Flavisolibacter sp.]|nr:hypothetical protein [Flavisolibacter sp.]